jgi:hypothetical protein
MQPLLMNYKTRMRTVLWRPWLLYGVLGLAVLAPLVRPGYILTLDMVFTPNLHMPTSSSNDYLFRVLLYGLHLLLPSDLIEKALLFAILLLAGTGMYRLVDYLKRTDADTYHIVGSYVAGMFYMINPFTYDRFMAGQYEVLLGYALLPWFVQRLLSFLASPDWHRILWLTLWSVVISIVSIHDIGLMAILAISGLGAMAWRRRGDREWYSKVWRFGLFGAGLFIVASSYWLVPLTLDKGSVATQISSISTNDQSAFATVGGSVLGRVGNIVRLQGFWAEARSMYKLPQARLHAWGLIGLLVWSLVITGSIRLWRGKQRAVVAMLGIAALVGGVMATGACNGWLAKHIPLLAGYREPEKFVALLALAYAVFAAYGIAATLAYCRTHGGKFFSVGVAIAIALLPIAWTPTMLYGFAGQLHAVHYPDDWSVVDARLKSDPDNFQTLFLPWHLYMHFNFEGRIIASPAAAYFDKPVIVSDNPEFHGAALAKTTAVKQALDNILPQAEYQHNFGAQLAVYHIKYVIVDHDDGYQDEAYLAHRSDMQLVAKGPTLALYRNKAYSEK